jgi:uncharacterized protein YraI
MKKLIAIILLIVGIVMFYITTVGVGVAEVVSNGVNLRKGPGKNYEVITVLKKGQKISILEYTNKDWVRIQLSNKTIGYITSSSEYVSIRYIDIDFAIQKLTKFVKTDNSIVDDKSNNSNRNDYASIRNEGILKSDFINMDQYSNTIHVHEFDNKTVVENAFFSTGEYKVTLRFSKKGQICSIITEGGNKFEWFSDKNDEIIVEKIRFTASDLGSIDISSGDFEGDIKIDIQKL